MKISVFTTCGNPVERQDPFYEAMESYRGFADELLLVDGSQNETDIDNYPGPKLWDRKLYHHWPEEFKWDFIGQQFQRGYEACTGDWVIRADLDFLFHEDSYALIRKALEENHDKPALSFWKYQFIVVDKFNIKSRLVLAFNKGLVGDRIKLDAGGDLCQPSLDGSHLDQTMVPEAKVPFYNYDFVLKTEDVVRKDIARFARAWERHFGNTHLGGDDESAFKRFLEMQLGRHNKPSNKIGLGSHPKVAQKFIKQLTPAQFGHSLWGRVKPASYFTG